jgi:hypothetical protein
MNYEVEAIRDSYVGYKIFCYNGDLAKKLNKVLKAYDFKFESDDEAIFRLNEEQYKKVQKILRMFRN